MQTGNLATAMMSDDLWAVKIKAMIRQLAEIAAVKTAPFFRGQMQIHLRSLARLATAPELHDFLSNLVQFKIFPEAEILNLLLNKLISLQMWENAAVLFQVAKERPELNADTYLIILQQLKKARGNAPMAQQLLGEAIERKLVNKKIYNLALQILAQDPDLTIADLTIWLDSATATQLTEESFRQLAKHTIAAANKVKIAQQIEFFIKLRQVATMAGLANCNYAAILSIIASAVKPDLGLAQEVLGLAKLENGNELSPGLQIRMEVIMSKLGPRTEPSVAAEPVTSNSAPDLSALVASSQEPESQEELLPKNTLNELAVGERRELFAEYADSLSGVKLAKIRSTRLYPRLARSLGTQTQQLAGLDLQLDKRLEKMYVGIFSA